MTTAQVGFVWMFLGLTTIGGFLTGKFGSPGSELILFPAVIATIVGGLLGFVTVFSSSK